MDTKEVRAKLADPAKWADHESIKEYLGWSSVTLHDLCSQLDALRKPVEGPRPRTVTRVLDEALERPVKPATREVLDYVLALEAENRRLREDLRLALACYRDETDTMLTVRDKEIAEIEARLEPGP